MLNLTDVKPGDVIAGMGQVGVISDIFISPITNKAIVSIHWAKNLVGQNQRPDLLQWEKVSNLVERSNRVELLKQINQLANTAQNFADDLLKQAADLPIS